MGSLIRVGTWTRSRTGPRIEEVGTADPDALAGVGEFSEIRDNTAHVGTPNEVTTRRGRPGVRPIPDSKVEDAVLCNQSSGRHNCKVAGQMQKPNIARRRNYHFVLWRWQ